MSKKINQKLRGLCLAGAVLLASTAYGADHALKAVDLSVARDQTNRLSVVLQSQADENTVKFSLCYDTTLLTFIDAVRGSVHGVHVS